MAAGNRIDGWKAIGAHFGRDRTTAMRWAQTRGLPVRRIPGGKTATVYALRDELDRWASQQSDDDVTGSMTPAQGVPAPVKRSGRSRLLLMTAALVVSGMAAAGVAALVLADQPDPAEAEAATLPLPSDPALATLYLEARDDWAVRTPEALGRAIKTLETVTRRAPDFAPAFSALADAYLLSREFGAMPDAEAFEQARTAAHASLRLEPDLASAHRSIGFIQYWADNDPVASGRSFRRAIELSPNSAQTHFWYGNVLSDNGAHDAALRELNKARLLEPGSVAIQTDLAWAKWAAGRQTAAREALDRLAVSAPTFPVVQDCLSILYLAEGDVGGYVRAFTRYAELRDDLALRNKAAALETAWADSPEATRRLLLSTALSDVENGAARNRAWAAFVASTSGDRAALLDILTQADRAQERWGAAGTSGVIRRRWSRDPEILRLLDRRRPHPVE